MTHVDEYEYLWRLTMREICDIRKLLAAQSQTESDSMLVGISISFDLSGELLVMSGDFAELGTVLAVSGVDLESYVGRVRFGIDPFGGQMVLIGKVEPMLEIIDRINPEMGLAVRSTLSGTSPFASMSSGYPPIFAPGYGNTPASDYGSLRGDSLFGNPTPSAASHPLRQLLGSLLSGRG